MIERRSKKSESIEVRLSHTDKLALMSRAAAEGRSASDIVRGSLNSYIGEHPRKPPSSLRKLARGITFVALPATVLALAYSISSPARADREYELAFRSSLQRLDKDHNGVIDRREFAAQSFITLIPTGAADGIVSGIIHRPPNSLVSSPELRGEFAAQDQDGDGSITLGEYVAYRHNVAHRDFGTLDADSNGRISLAEFRRRLGVPAGERGRELFVSQDANHDGWLSEEELDR